jgi:hypothetical protein
VHSAQLDILHFHNALNIPIGDSPAIRRRKLRATLISEEALETCDAIATGNMIEAIDGMCDLLVVTYGTAVEFGIDIEPFWDEVHRSNMAKMGGPVRADGKVLKPPGWTPPDLERIYKEKYGNSSK